MSSRKLRLNKAHEVSGDYVIYLMSRDQRVNDNHALLLAQQEALNKKLPLLVVFCLYQKSGVRAQEHFKFMLEGLKSLEKEFNKLNINFCLIFGDPKVKLKEFFKVAKPASIYFDFSPLKGPRNLQKYIAQSVNIPVYCVDTHNIIPLWVLSEKQEFAAHTIRGKVHKQLIDWLKEPPKIQKHPFAPKASLEKPNWQKAEKIIKKISSNGSRISQKSGQIFARQTLDDFIKFKLDNFAIKRNDPSDNFTSQLSPYLHFGQISSLRVALEVIEKSKVEPLLFTQNRLAQSSGEISITDGVNALLEELIVRKELADNYCFYNENYDNFDGAWSWAKDTLNQHRTDDREFLYTLKDLENCQTHDEAWNSAQKQMMKTGIMHGYMRMYWAKKILEWSKTPEEAIKNTIYLNDRYSLDGGDPNGYTGIMWSITGVHDRPWFDRPIYGKIRYMNDQGLKKKFDLESYIKKWN